MVTPSQTSRENLYCVLEDREDLGGDTIRLGGTK